MAVGTGMPTAFLTEAFSTITFRRSGTLSKLYVRVISNDHTSLTFTLRKNGADGNLNVAYGSSATGVQTDDVNTDTIAAGDTVSLKVIGAGGTAAQPTLMAFVWTPDAGSPVVFFNGNNAGIGNSDVTEFIQFVGRSNVDATEANRRFRALAAGRLEHLQVLGTNQGANTITFRSRVNSANGAQSVAIASSGSNGEDTTNHDDVAADDDIGLSSTTGAGMATSNFPLFSCVFDADPDFQYVTGTIPAATSVLAGVTEYFPLGGDLTGIAGVESDYQTRAAFEQRLSKLTIYIVENTLTASSTLRIRINGADGSQAVTIPSGATGLFQDLVNQDVVAAGDLLTYQFQAGGTGTEIRPSYVAMLSGSPADPSIGFVINNLRPAAFSPGIAR